MAGEREKARRAGRDREGAFQALPEYRRLVLRRLGDTPQAAFDWLLNFAEKPLDSVTHGDRISLEEEILGFLRGDPMLLNAYPRLPLRAKKLSQSFLNAATEGVRGPWTFAKIGSRSGMGMSPEILRSLQQIAKAALEELLTAGGVEFHEIKLDFVVVRMRSDHGLPDDDPDRPLRYGGLTIGTDSYEAGMRYWLAVYLGEFGAAVSRCGECTRLFREARSWQRFCSPECQSRNTSRAFRGRQERDRRARAKRASGAARGGK